MALVATANEIIRHALSTKNIRNCECRESAMRIPRTQQHRSSSSKLAARTANYWDPSYVKLTSKPYVAGAESLTWTHLRKDRDVGVELRKPRNVANFPTRSRACRNATPYARSGHTRIVDAALAEGGGRPYRGLTLPPPEATRRLQAAAAAVAAVAAGEQPDGERARN